MPNVAAIVLNGTTAHATLTHASALNPAGDWTVEMWAKTTKWNVAGNRYLIQKGTAGNRPYDITVSNGTIVVKYYNAFTDGNLSTSVSALSTAAWHHIAVTYESAAQKLRIYVDGALVATSGTLATSPAGDTSNVTIGMGNSGNRWEGSLDEIRIWNVRRSDAEIAAYKDKQADGTEIGLLDCFSLNAGTGSTAASSTSSGRTLALTNTSWDAVDFPSLTDAGAGPLTAATPTLIASSPSGIQLSTSVSGGTAPYTYQWYRHTNASLVVGAPTLISGATSNPVTDTPPTDGVYWYAVRVTDAAAAVVTTAAIPALLYETALKVGFIGDSIGLTGAVTAPVHAGRVLEKILGIRSVTVVNQHQSGSAWGHWEPADAYTLAAKAAFEAVGVSIVCIMLGINGLSDTATEAEAPANVANYISAMQTIVNYWAGLGYTVIVNVPLWTINTSKTMQLQMMGEALPSITNGTTIHMGDQEGYAWSALHPSEMSDGVHLNDTGAISWGTLLAMGIARVVLDLGDGEIVYVTRRRLSL